MNNIFFKIVLPNTTGIRAAAKWGGVVP